MAEELGLTIDLYQPFRDFEAVPEPDFRRAEAKFDVMEELGAPTPCSSARTSRPRRSTTTTWPPSSCTRWPSERHERGLRIAYEALAWGRHVNEYDHAWRIVAAADHPALGTCLDSFHILSRGTDLGAIAGIDKVFYLQLADAPHLSMDVLQWSRHHRCFPGQGSFDLADFVARVLATGYDGPLSLEVFNDVFRQADPDRTAIDAMRSLLVLEDELPASPALDGFAFVEIGVDGAFGAGDRGAAADARASRTSARTAASRSSSGSTATSASWSTTAWATTTPRSWPSRSRAPTRSASAERAEALLAPVLERRRGPGEADLAAIAAPDGTSVFFCGPDRSWLRRLRRARGRARRTAVPIDRASTTSRSRSRSTPSTRPGCSTARCSTCGPPRAPSWPRPAAWSAAGRWRTAPCGSCSTCPRWPAPRPARPSSSTWPSRARTRSPPPARCTSAARRSCRSRATTTTISPPATSSPFLDELRELGRALRPQRERRAPALLQRPRGPRVLRGARAAGGLRRLRGRELTRADGSATNHHEEETCSARRSSKLSRSRAGSRARRRRSASCPRRRRCAGSSGRASS